MVRRIIYLIALSVLLAATGYAQTTTTTTYTITVKAPCVPSVGAPRYYCLGNLTNPAGSNLTEWDIYTGSINADGSFNTGTTAAFGIDDFDDPTNPLYLAAAQVDGTEDLISGVLNGTFSGTVTPGNPGGPSGTFVGAFTNLTPGSMQRCLRGQRPPHCGSQRAIVAGTVVVTMTLQ
jgi:hypothetical protein